MLILGWTIFIIGFIGWLIGITGTIVTKFDNMKWALSQAIFCLIVNIGNIIIQVN